jgi:hypothetical protein
MVRQCIEEEPGKRGLQPEPSILMQKLYTFLMLSVQGGGEL